MSTQIASSSIPEDDLPNIRLKSQVEKTRVPTIEAAGLKATVTLFSPEAKRLWRDVFLLTQACVHYVRVIGRYTLDDSVVDKAEAMIENQLSKQMDAIDLHIASTTRRCNEKGVKELATYNVKPLILTVSVFSTFDNRFLDLIAKVDQIMPMLETLAIGGHIGSKGLAEEKNRAKKTASRVHVVARQAKGHLYNLSHGNVRTSPPETQAHLTLTPAPVGRDAGPHGDESVVHLLSSTATSASVTAAGAEEENTSAPFGARRTANTTNTDEIEPVLLPPLISAPMLSPNAELVVPPHLNGRDGLAPHRANEALKVNGAAIDIRPAGHEAMLAASPNAQAPAPEDAHGADAG